MDGPEFPDVLSYLYVWVMELCGRSGVGLSGVAPLTYATLNAWQQQMKVRELRPSEVKALFRLDVVLRHPESED